MAGSLFGLTFGPAPDPSDSFKKNNGKNTSDQTKSLLGKRQVKGQAKQLQKKHDMYYRKTAVLFPRLSKYCLTQAIGILFVITTAATKTLGPLYSFILLIGMDL